MTPTPTAEVYDSIGWITRVERQGLGKCFAHAQVRVRENLGVNTTLGALSFEVTPQVAAELDEVLKTADSVPIRVQLVRTMPQPNVATPPERV